MPRPEINVTPLIDILLVLLIIFMIVTPVKPSKFEARVPSEPKSTLEVDNNPLTLVVAVGRDSSISLNNDAIGATVDSPERLIERLREIFAARTRNLVYSDTAGQTSAPAIEKTVFIKAPRSLSYGSVARVVDSVKNAGADPVSLQIDGLS